MSESIASRASLWESLLSSAISQAVDPAPIRLTDRDFSRGRVVVTACRRGMSKTLQLRTAIPRNAFLAACFELAGCASLEHLILGFGVRWGSSTLVARVAHRLGDRSSVSFPLDLQREIAAYVRGGHRNEVLVFHNHPSNPINVICDNEPWASPQDRAVAMRHTVDPIMLIKALTNGGRTRFYVAENGYLREFVGPDAFTFLKNLGPK